MGQAKSRKSEIAALKAQSSTLNIMAIRHLKNGQSEFCSFSINMQSVHASKSHLLNYICTNKWLHNPPVEAIAAYLLMTDTYRIFKETKLNVCGYIINFYEQDIVHSETYSCRGILVANSQEKWNELVNFNVHTLTAANDIDVRKYA